MEDNFLIKISQQYSEQNYRRIERAYYFAKTAHKGQKRQSGEDYFVHPSEVAEILVDLGLDTDTIIAALLHDVIEDTLYTEESIGQEFGQEVLMLVNGVTKLNKLNFKSKEEEQAENLRRMFLAMSNDIRVIIIKLADRLHNMRTLSYKNEESQVRIATETLDIYAPIAARLGISNVKGELEDLCLRYLHPTDYYFIAEKVAHTKLERQDFVNKTMSELQVLLDELDIKGEINGRPKHFYSIYRKLQTGKTFEQIYDLIALRVIVDSVKDCYAVLGSVHTKWKPLPGRFKDYISVPKSNLYQSLHTTVLSSYGMPFEIQIRTMEMHKIAEYGIAAHWKYKEGITDKPSSIDENKLTWIRNVMELQNEVSDSREYLDSLKMDLYADQVFVFTPAGDVFNLPNGSTGIDFAYAIHSQVGNKCTGIKINSTMVPITTRLTNGDVVEVVTSNAAKGPSRDWLKYVITPSAKSKIKSFFKKEMHEENVKRGKEILEKDAKNRGFILKNLVECNTWLNYIQGKYNHKNVEEIYALVGYGDMTSQQVMLKMVDCYCQENNIERSKLVKQPQPKIVTQKIDGSSGILVSGATGMKIRFSHCCTPLPGDKIIGYVSQNRGVIIHRADCPNCVGLNKNRLINVE
ncbi:MAG: bifunctional (p)ppGpp synthetase/guanosine-3',5'-bis(diphosphate) 3'-pyrophosphohydrolase, partial [Clostridia bacterium]